MSRKTAILALWFTPVLLVAGDPASPPQQPASTANLTGGTPKATFGHAETLSATIKFVDVDAKLLFVQTSDRVSYSFIVGPATRISSGSQQIALADLARYAGKPASIKFVATRQGNIARSIEIAQ